MAKFCMNCGNPIQPTEKFCQNCGAPLQAEAPQAPVEQELHAPTETIPAEAAPKAEDFPVSQQAAPITQEIPVPQQAVPITQGIPVPQQAVPIAQGPAVPAAAEMPVGYGNTVGQPQPVPYPYNMPAYGEAAVPKKKKVSVAKVVIACVLAVCLIAGIAVLVISMVNGGSLDGTYKMTGLMYGEEDYSSMISMMGDSYKLTISGDKATMEFDGETFEIDVDVKNHTFRYEGEQIQSFTTDGKSITIEEDGAKMIFTKE